MTMLKVTSYPDRYDHATTYYMKSITDHHRYAGDHHAKTSRLHAKSPGLVKERKKQLGDLSIFPPSITSTEMKEGRRFTSKKKLKARGRRKK